MTIDALKDEEAEIQALEKDAGQASPETSALPPSQAPEPEPVETDAPEIEGEELDGDNRGRFIRRAEYKAAEDARKAAESRVREVEARYAQDMAKLNERMAIVAQNLSQPARPAQEQKPVELPDINTDPIGHFQAKNALLEQKLAEVDRFRQQQTQQGEQAEQLRRVGEAVRNAEVEYAKTVPDYPQAQEHLMRQWMAEADAAGMPHEQVIRARALEIAAVAGQRGMNPADLAYKLATSRGYAKTAPQQQTQQAQPQSGPSIETLTRGIQAAKSGSAAPGRAAPGQMSAEALLQMEDAEFAKKFGGRDNTAWAKLMGGGGRA